MLWCHSTFNRCLIATDYMYLHVGVSRESGNCYQRGSVSTCSWWSPTVITTQSASLYNGRYIPVYFLLEITVKLETLALLNFDESWFIEFWRKKCWRIACKCCWIASFKGANFAWWLYFERFKFGDFTLIRQIRQSFHSSKFPVLRYISNINCCIQCRILLSSKTLSL